MGSDDLDKAMGLLKKASAADKNCARVSIMSGRIWIARSDDAKAIVELEKVIEQDKDFVSETLPMLYECYQRLGQQDLWVAYLKRCVAEQTGSAAELMLADMLELREGRDAAQAYVNHQLQIHPTMRGFYRLMNYQLAEAEEGRAKESLIVLQEMVGEQIRSRPRYCCEKCGLTANSLYWHCPSCKAWSTVKPIRGLDGQ
ncbi:tetratricopeptide repeat protein [Leminorella grimontii]|nr:tetratricopeptide repeat protein [Leminorella grimontii]